MVKVSDRSLKYMSFIQAISLMTYIGLITTLLSNGNKLFNKLPNYMGPLLFLTLFSTSALICGLITFYFPFVLFVHKKQPSQAIKMIMYLVRWLILSTLLILGSILLFK